MAEKVVVFDHLLPLLAPGGCVFGASLVQGDAPRSRAAVALMRAYNRRGIFHNEEDSAGELAGALGRRFAESRVVLRGCAALFWARRPYAES
jgi:hypothetical protein